MKRFSKQTKKELKSLAEQVRRWQPMYVELTAKLFIHIKAQEQEIEQLERHLSELRQMNFLRKSQELSAPAVIEPPKEKPRKYPLAERLTLMERGSKEWLLALRYNNLTEVQALELIAEFKKSQKAIDIVKHAV